MSIEKEACNKTGNNILPTKADLLHQALVVINSNHKQITTNSIKVSEVFSKRPADVNRRIVNLNKKGACKIAPNYYLDEQGRKQKYYVLDRKNFSIVVLGFTGNEAEKFRVEYVEQFEKNATELLEWRKLRQAVIEPTKMASDSIQWLRLELEKEIPESRKPGLLHTHIQRAITKYSTGNSNIKREVMTARQLKLVEWLEKQVHDEIERLKALGLPATEIRKQILLLLKGNE